MTRRAPTPEPAARTGPREGEAGFVLVSVLAAVALFVAAAAGLAVKARLHLLQTANRVEAARLEALADGAALFAADALRPAPGTPLDSAALVAAAYRGTAADAAAAPAPEALPLPVDGTPVACPFGGARLVVSAADEGGLLDLNGAPAAMLSAFFSAAGLGAVAAQDLAEEIVDFRDPDDAPEGNGVGEAAAYAAEGLAWGPRNAPFADVEEIAQLPSATPSLVARLRPMLTVGNPRAGLDLASMTRDARALLPEKADEDGALKPWLASSPRTDFAVEARLLRADGSLGAGRRALVTFRGGAAPGAFAVLRWSRLPPLAGLDEGALPAVSGTPFCAALAAALEGGQTP